MNKVENHCSRWMWWYLRGVAIGTEENGLWKLSIRCEPSCLSLSISETSGNLLKLWVSTSASVCCRRKARFMEWSWALNENDVWNAFKKTPGMMLAVQNIIYYSHVACRGSLLYGKVELKSLTCTGHFLLIYTLQFSRAPLKGYFRRKGSLWKDFLLEEEIYTLACPPHVSMLSPVFCNPSLIILSAIFVTGPHFHDMPFWNANKP